MHSYDNYFLKFVTESTAYPVQYRKRKGALLYEASTYWVDPDIDNAAAHINEVWINEKLARAKAAYASEWLIETFSTNAVGTSMYKRLKVCWLCHNSHNVIYIVSLILITCSLFFRTFGKFKKHCYLIWMHHHAPITVKEEILSA